MYTHKTISQIKSEAKELLKGHYTPIMTGCILIGLIQLTISTFLNSLIIPDTLLTGIIYYLALISLDSLISIFLFGLNKIALDTIVMRSAITKDIVYGFKHNTNKHVKLSFIIILLTNLPLLLMSIIVYSVLPAITDSIFIEKYNQISSVILLLIITLVICFFISILLSQSYFVVLTHPNVGVVETLAISNRLINGHKKRYFLMLLSFVPLIILGIISCGAGLLFVAPYIRIAKSIFFLDILKSSQMNTNHSS